MSTDSERVYRLRQSGSYWMDVEGQIIAMHPDMSRYLGTNPSGTLLWKTLDNGATASELAGALQEAYGIEADRAAADVATYLAMLPKDRRFERDNNGNDTHPNTSSHETYQGNVHLPHNPPIS